MDYKTVHICHRPDDFVATLTNEKGTVFAISPEDIDEIESNLRRDGYDLIYLDVFGNSYFRKLVRTQ